MTNKRKWVCPQCDGYGYIMIEEDGFEVPHSCYHCYEEGYLNYDPDVGPNEEVNDGDSDLRG